MGSPLISQIHVAIPRKDFNGVSGLMVTGLADVEDAGARTAVQPLPPLILVTTVDIGEGKNGQIELRQGDDPLVSPLIRAKEELEEVTYRS